MFTVFVGCGKESSPINKRGKTRIASKKDVHFERKLPGKKTSKGHRVKSCYLDRISERA